MKEHYVSYEQAKRLHELGFDGVDKYYVTENFCSGNNPISFDTYSVGDLVDEYIVYFVNENNEDDYRGIPAPRLDQAQAWLRELGALHINVYPAIPFNKWKFNLDDLGQSVNPTNGELNCRITEEMTEKFEDGWYDTYESALSAGISKALELLGKEEKV